MNPAALLAVLGGDLASALIASTPGGIEQQEAQGQATLVRSAMLPKEIIGATREELTAIGFRFGDDADDLFVKCELPQGWQKRATEHPMHSDLLDEHGRRRASIFYKAAFYDRRADMHMRPRYRIDPYRDGSSEQHMRCVVTDGDQVVFDAGECGAKDYDQSGALRAKCTDWLNNTFPNWKSPLAYW